MIPFSYVWGSRATLLFVDDQLWVCWPVEKPLEMHGIIKDLLRPDDLVEAEVVVPFLQGVERYVTIVLAQWMRRRIQVHV